MKLLTVILFFSSLSAFCQQEEIFQAINERRSRLGLEALIYDYNEQFTVDDRAKEVSRAFAIDNNCRCEYETIACNTSISTIIKQLINTRQEWFHFSDEARFITIGIYKANGLYYCVVHTFKE